MDAAWDFDRCKGLIKSDLISRKEQGAVITEETLRNSVMPFVSFLTESQQNQMIVEMMFNFQHDVPRPYSLAGEFEEWLPEIRSEVEWDYWLRYKEHIQKDLPYGSVVSMAETTDDILGFLGNPALDTSWDRRGLAVGEVQSGKTANFIGVMNKALDVKYKVIIILTGFTEELRKQTQRRVDDGSLGYYYVELNNDVDSRNITGVGHINSSLGQVPSYTSAKHGGDFNLGVAEQFQMRPGEIPIVFVVKKNAFILRNLINWFRLNAGARDQNNRRYHKKVPLLIIDDECDIGSVNTKKDQMIEDGYGDVDPNLDHDPAKINKQIRKLLSLFDQKSYLGYTATPFANVLIHTEAEASTDTDGLLIGDDLFPRDFIIALPTPPNHVGPTMMFGIEDDDGQSQEGLPLIRIITDHLHGETDDDRWMPRSKMNQRDHVPKYDGEERVPPSLRGAIIDFILASTARHLRGFVKGKDGHNSMLVHSTRLIDVQERVRDQVSVELFKIKDALDSNDRTVLREIKNRWENFVRTTCDLAQREGDLFQNAQHDWDDIKPLLRERAHLIEVRRISGNSSGGVVGEILDYEEAEKSIPPRVLNVIAIGGDKLARGLTLKNLTVSYFLRTSSMYDTLMQMGRWFGYRDGYLDLCRLYLPKPLADSFFHISTAGQELRDDFKRMNALNEIPKDYGLKIKTHPALMVTSATKRRYAQEAQVTFSGCGPQTIHFSRDPATVKSNWEAAVKLAEAIESTGIEIAGPPSRINGWENVPADLVRQFFNDYQDHPRSLKFVSKRLAEYIEKEEQLGRLINWTVHVSSSSQCMQKYNLASLENTCVDRGWHLIGAEEYKEIEKEELISEGHFKIKALDHPPDLIVDLTAEERVKALASAKQRWRDNGEKGAGPSEFNFGSTHARSERDPSRGLLILYPISTDGSYENSENNAETSEFPILGVSIEFPHHRNASKVTYTINSVYQNQE